MHSPSMRTRVAVVLAVVLVVVFASAASAYTRRDGGAEKRQNGRIASAGGAARSAARRAQHAGDMARRVGVNLADFQGANGRTLAGIVSAGLVTQQNLGDLSTRVGTLADRLDRVEAQAQAHAYGVAALVLGDARQSLVWTPDLPADANNAAQATDETVVRTPADCAGAACVLRLRAAIRSNAPAAGAPAPAAGVPAPAAGAPAGLVGGKIVVTLDTGALFASAQTPPNAAGRPVVPVQGPSALTSADPTSAGAGGTDVPLADPTPNPLTLAPSTTYVVHSTVQFFPPTP